MDAVEEIKQRLSIEDVIAEYVQLKRAGRNLRGLSPFNTEKTASFMVSPEKQIWHDFSSGKGGNMFSFVMEMEGLDFKGALELLARKAGIDLDQYRGKSNTDSQLKKRLYEAMEKAARFYQVQFSQNQMALKYVLRQRRFSKATALEFRIGYAPNTGTALYNYLKKQGFTENEMTKAGLVTKRYRGPADMFRGRLMIPLADPQGQIIGFTARLLDDEPDAPKYINTPQTLLYDKSRHVFGLNLAKDAIRKSGFGVIVEGNLDVIASHQAGVRNVVATAGTAITQWQLKALGRFGTDVRLAFDQDKAGQAATERAIPIAAKVGVNLGVVIIKDAKDPDELIQKQPDQWPKTINKPQAALDWLIDRYQAQLDLGSAAGKKQFSDILVKVIGELPDKVEQEHYLTKIAGLLGVSTDALSYKMSNRQRQPGLKQNRSTIEKTDSETQERIKLQDHLLALLIHQSHLRHYVDPLYNDMIIGDAATQVMAFFKANPTFDGDFEAAPDLRKLQEYGRILELQYETLYQNLDPIELEYEAARLQARLIEHYVKTQKLRLAEALLTSDDQKTLALLGEVKSLDKLLNNAKEKTTDGR